MKFSISAAFVFAAISANLVSARPLFQKQTRQASTTPVGAAYCEFHSFSSPHLY